MRTHPLSQDLAALPRRPSLRIRSGLRAGEDKKKQEYLIVKMSDILVTG